MRWWQVALPLFLAAGSLAAEEKSAFAWKEPRIGAGAFSDRLGIRGVQHPDEQLVVGTESDEFLVHVPALPEKGDLLGESLLVDPDVPEQLGDGIGEPPTLADQSLRREHFDGDRDRSEHEEPDEHVGLSFNTRSFGRRRSFPRK